MFALIPLALLCKMILNMRSASGKGGTRVGHLFSPWWVTGPVYAKGKHVKGHSGTIYSAPYGGGSADVEVLPVSSPSSTPWFCGCDQLQAAFFSAAVYTGAGWRWHRQDPRNMDSRVILHCFLDVNTKAGDLEATHLLNWGIEQVKSRNLLPDHEVVDLCQRDPEVIKRQGDRWVRHQATFACCDKGNGARFGEVHRDSTIRLTVVSITE